MLLTRRHATPVVTLFLSPIHVTYVTSHHTAVIRYSTSILYATSCRTSGHLVIYLECYEFDRAFFTLRRFFTLYSLLLFKAFPGAGSSTSKLAGFHADLRSTALARLYVSITTIRKRFICGRFYLRV